jgi:hypothetical protein
MISRLTASAACFAVLSAATITFAAVGRHPDATPTTAAAASAPVVQLAPVLVIGRRVER